VDSVLRNRSSSSRGDFVLAMSIPTSIPLLEFLWEVIDGFVPEGRFQQIPWATHLGFTGGDLFCRDSLLLLPDQSDAATPNHSRHKVLTFSNSLRNGVQLLKTTESLHLCKTSQACASMKRTADISRTTRLSSQKSAVTIRSNSSVHGWVTSPSRRRTTSSFAQSLQILSKFRFLPNPTWQSSGQLATKNAAPNRMRTNQGGCADRSHLPAKPRYFVDTSALCGNSTQCRGTWTGDYSPEISGPSGDPKSD
jgi:hypothetical protein